jgi:hypothetical protein
MHQEDIERALQPLVAYLQSAGVMVETQRLLPNVFATLSKRMILELTQHPEVGIIYLLDGVEAPG